MVVVVIVRIERMSRKIIPLSVLKASRKNSKSNERYDIIFRMPMAGLGNSKPTCEATV